MRRMCLCLVMVALVLTACTTSTPAIDDTEEKVLYLNNGSEPSSFNPPVGFDTVSWNPLNNLLEGLTRLGEKHIPEAAMAEHWEVSEDGKTYTFYLRKDAVWSNGDPVTAHDFVFAWKELLAPETLSPAAFLGYFIEGGQEYNSGEGERDDVAVSAINDFTLEVTLTAPTGFFLHVVANPAFFPVNQRVALEDPDWHTEASTFVSNGPFTLEEWEHHNYMVFSKNEQYWDAESVELDKILWSMVSSPNTEYQMFKTGELDASTIPSELVGTLMDDERVVITDQAGLDFYRFNVTMEPFHNRKIRQAFALAINQEEIVEYVTQHGEKPAKGFISPGFRSPSGMDFRIINGDLVDFDPERARRLLREGMEEEGYEELPEVVLSYNTSESNKGVAEAMQAMFLEHLGIEVRLISTEWNVFLEDQKALNLQLSRSSFLYDYGDPINFLESFTSNSTMNRTGWENNRYDLFIESAKQEDNEERRWLYMYEAEKMLAEEMPILPLNYYNHVHIYNEKVDGIIHHPVGYVELKWARKY